MGKFVQMILETFGGIAPREVIVFLISTLPVLELRGGLLAASWLGIKMWRCNLCGRMLPAGAVYSAADPPRASHHERLSSDCRARAQD